MHAASEHKSATAAASDAAQRAQKAAAQAAEAARAKARSLQRSLGELEHDLEGAKEDRHTLSGGPAAARSPLTPSQRKARLAHQILLLRTLLLDPPAPPTYDAIMLPDDD
ncbi:MAG: hypothetical protein VXW43_19895, partial [Pseudomonadota bacterium]|nr:hypothetical protein [Pseudomonadota bacterium]